MNKIPLMLKQLMKELVLPWDNTDTFICADSYFTSVIGAE